MKAWLGTKAPGSLLKALGDAGYGAYLGSFFDPSIATSLSEC